MEPHMLNYIKLSFSVLILTAAQVFSQPTNEEQLSVTLEKSVAMALAHNPTMKVAEKQLEKAEAEVVQAYSLILPQLDASVNFQHAWAIQESTIPNFLKPMLAPIGEYIEGIDQMPDYVSIAFGRENTLTYGLTLTQPLFLGGAGLAGISLSKAGARAAEHNLENIRQQLIFLSVDGFYSCLLAQKLITVQEEAMAQAKENREVVLKKYNVGAASGYDKMRAEVEED